MLRKCLQFFYLHKRVTKAVKLERLTVENSLPENLAVNMKKRCVVNLKISHFTCSDCSPMDIRIYCCMSMTIHSFGRPENLSFMSSILNGIEPSTVSYSLEENIELGNNSKVKLFYLFLLFKLCCENILFSFVDCTRFL